MRRVIIALGYALSRWHGMRFRSSNELRPKVDALEQRLQSSVRQSESTRQAVCEILGEDDFVAATFAVKQVLEFPALSEELVDIICSTIRRGLPNEVKDGTPADIVEFFETAFEVLTTLAKTLDNVRPYLEELVLSTDSFCRKEAAKALFLLDAETSVDKNIALAFRANEDVAPSGDLNDSAWEFDKRYAKSQQWSLRAQRREDKQELVNLAVEALRHAVRTVVPTAEQLPYLLRLMAPEMRRNSVRNKIAHDLQENPAYLAALLDLVNDPDRALWAFEILALSVGVLTPERIWPNVKPLLRAENRSIQIAARNTCNACALSVEIRGEMLVLLEEELCKKNPDSSFVRTLLAAMASSIDENDEHRLSFRNLVFTRILSRRTGDEVREYSRLSILRGLASEIPHNALLQAELSAALDNEYTSERAITLLLRLGLAPQTLVQLLGLDSPGSPVAGEPEARYRSLVCSVAKLLEGYRLPRKEDEGSIDSSEESVSQDALREYGEVLFSGIVARAREDNCYFFYLFQRVQSFVRESTFCSRMTDELRCILSSNEQLALALVEQTASVYFSTFGLEECRRIMGDCAARFPQVRAAIKVHLKPLCSKPMSQRARSRGARRIKATRTRGQRAWEMQQRYVQGKPSDRSDVSQMVGRALLYFCWLSPGAANDREFFALTLAALSSEEKVVRIGGLRGLLTLIETNRDALIATLEQLEDWDERFAREGGVDSAMDLIEADLILAFESAVKNPEMAALCQATLETTLSYKTIEVLLSALGSREDDEEVCSMFVRSLTELREAEHEIADKGDAYVFPDSSLGVMLAWEEPHVFAERVGSALARFAQRNATALAALDEYLKAAEKFDDDLIIGAAALSVLGSLGTLLETNERLRKNVAKLLDVRKFRQDATRALLTSSTSEDELFALLS
ncbi:MAG: hypothetical protein KDD69_07210 [Bdellovibrionales bacterium]|nr:hypothetical protein [Bdellovibrionales bacterium]